MSFGLRDAMLSQLHAFQLLYKLPLMCAKIYQIWLRRFKDNSTNVRWSPFLDHRVYILYLDFAPGRMRDLFHANDTSVPHLLLKHRSQAAMYYVTPAEAVAYI